MYLILDYLKKTVYNLFTITTNLQGSVISSCMKLHGNFKQNIKLQTKYLKNTFKMFILL